MCECAGSRRVLRLPSNDQCRRTARGQGRKSGLSWLGAQSRKRRRNRLLRRSGNPPRSRLRPFHQAAARSPAFLRGSSWHRAIVRHRAMSCQRSRRGLVSGQSWDCLSVVCCAVLGARHIPLSGRAGWHAQRRASSRARSSGAEIRAKMGLCAIRFHKNSYNGGFADGKSCFSIFWRDELSGRSWRVSVGIEWFVGGRSERFDLGDIQTRKTQTTNRQNDRKRRALKVSREHDDEDKDDAVVVNREPRIFCIARQPEGAEIAQIGSRQRPRSRTQQVETRR